MGKGEAKHALRYPEKQRLSDLFCNIGALRAETESKQTRVQLIRVFHWNMLFLFAYLFILPLFYQAKH